MKKLTLRTKTTEFNIEFDNNAELIEFVTQYTEYEKRHDIRALYNLGEAHDN